MKYWWAAKATKFLAFAVVAIALIGFAVMFLWNWLIPEIFGGPTVTYWQAMGLLLLSHILVRGWHGHSGGWKSHRWKHKMEEKLAAMTPEEREKFKEEWRRRCGYYPGDEKKEA
ncbi:MAG: hypothetical protein HYV29_10675 [Ignavibacteriales bacterium]|nr:hypothetical protein [Ignavibacteriales bacterium]